MPRSEWLRLKDVRAVYRLVGECRELGDDSMTWQRRLLTELTKLVGGQVGLGGCEGGLRSHSKGLAPSGLPPRIHRALEGLLEGNSETQVVRRMGLSHFTVHEYVKTIYAHFEASSRAELLALFLRRLRRPRPDG